MDHAPGPARGAPLRQNRRRSTRRFCYELNGLFAWLLGELGFRATLLSARVARSDGTFSPEFDHLVLRVGLPDGRPPAEGDVRSWIADVGFGDSFLEPVPLVAGRVVEPAGQAFRLVEAAESTDGWCLERRDGAGAWRPQYAFTLRERMLGEFDERCLDQQRSPASPTTRRCSPSASASPSRTTISADCTAFLIQALTRRADSPRDVTGVGAGPAGSHCRGESVLRAYGVSDRGRTRPTNEDCFAIEEDLGFCVVADGIGGHQGGEVAARLAVDAVREAVRERARPSEPASDPWPMGFDKTLSEPGNLLRTAIQLAGLRVLEAAVTGTGLVGMGTTVVSALVAGTRLSVAHVGDSRLYVAGRGCLRLLTEDDSWMATLLSREPSADASRFRHHPMRGALTNVVGSRIGTDVHVVEETLEGGELLVLTTDGVHDTLDEGELSRIVFGGGHAGEPRALAARLVAAAIERGSHDNCTAVVAQFDWTSSR